jgi:phosphatidylserine/phosphatidylglycerophosphate/cardiolipin synthase-like enzyme
LKNPSGLVRVVYPATLGKALPPPFKPEQTGGGGTRMHHKFVVIDFNEPTARVYFGSFNFSKAADGSNGENLTIIKDRRIATSFMIEAVRIFDHYAFRVARAKAKKDKKPLNLQRPPRAAGEKPWWDRFYTDPAKSKDRELFA